MDTVALAVEVEATRMGTMTALADTLVDTQDLETIQHLMPAGMHTLGLEHEVHDFSLYLSLSRL